MRDFDIRKALRGDLERLRTEDPETIIIDELGLCSGAVRVDIAVVNGRLNGYEIKSEHDTLGRLPAQQEVYNRVFDTVTIVTGERYVDRVMEQIPDWWGVVRAVEQDGQVGLERIREPGLNRDIDPFSLSQLLWRGEALAVLMERGLGRGMLRKPRRALWLELAASLPVDELRDVVAKQLKARESWRAVR